MLSRVAESVFWLSRYIERAENVARFIDVNHTLLLDLGEDQTQQWKPLVQTSGDAGLFAERYGEFTRENVLQFLTFDEANPNSISACLAAARENGRTVREVISKPMWEALNKFFLMVREAAGPGDVLTDPSRFYEFYNQIKLSSHLLVGITDATMAHGEAWHFGRMGRLLERADKTSRIVDVKYFFLLPDVRDVGSSLDVAQWLALLKSASALEMYRRTHGQIDPSSVVDFLVLDREFPRSIRFCLVKAEESLHAITGGAAGTFRTHAEQQLGRLRSEFDFTHVNDIFVRGVHEFVDGFQGKLNRVGEAIHESFFVSGVEQLASMNSAGETLQ